MMNPTRRRAPVFACVVWVLGFTGCAQHREDIVAPPGGYRILPPLCLPCGDERSLGIATRAGFSEVVAALEDTCGESTEATVWRQKVDDAGVDFDNEALVILWDWIGTRGQASLAFEEPSPGVLAVALDWDIPDGPALPVATAACYSLAVDKTLVNQVNVSKAGASVLTMTF